MRSDDNVVEVGLGEQRCEEGVGVRHAALADQVLVCDEAIAPVHGSLPALPTALNQEQGGRADLHAAAHKGLEGRQTTLRDYTKAELMHSKYWWAGNARHTIVQTGNVMQVWKKARRNAYWV